MKTPYFIQSIDWSELRNQKKLLLETINNDAVSPEHKEALEGILALIDATQDYAVDEMDLNPSDVYDFELEENRDTETSYEKFAREQAELIYQIHIEGSFIYENEEMNEEFIKSIVDDEKHATAIKAIMRNTILENIENGTIKILEYNIEMYEYGYKIEDYCLEQFYKDKTKTLWLCPNCVSDNVKIKTWTDANTFQITEDECPMEYNDCWCEDCESHGKLIHQEMPFLKKVIGFQVVSDDLIGDCDGELHPKMDGQSCVYNLSQAREILNNDNSWKLKTIWSGDIKNPVIMFGFENKPRA